MKIEKIELIIPTFADDVDSQTIQFNVIIEKLNQVIDELNKGK